ncbi:hypothetical protein HP567_011060 [Brevibacillus sp. M2.1A]|uniref:hypothetical protein n=1 Tax=Brevibacillus TaxID=55080 RepID=UPI00156AABFC|nr:MULTISPECIES: hypothetical protein [Brevibacillus]MCC8435082.1 hypothetical protein [Brevibacillus sp. M2.1A]MCE0452183.1 hypothetical protein [Brevibacillus sp. AF8]UKK97468.1 hypothetical protein FO446_08585 [Brevibacillus brevis]
MRKPKWMMMGVTAVVCSALLVPGAFAKEKDDSYTVTPSLITPGSYAVPTVQKMEAKNTQQIGASFTFAPTVNEKEEK